MKFKRYDLYIILLIVVVLAATFTFLPNEKVDHVTFMTDSGNVTVSVEVARTQEELRQGLMDRSSLDWDSGMLFMFEPPRVLNFWMKNTLIPLDMVFLSSEGEIIRIERDVPPCASEICPTYGGVYGAYVVEVNAGFCESRGIKEGDMMEFVVVK